MSSTLDELLIVGAGPAGVSAALWTRTFGLSASIVDAAAEVGGQLRIVRFHPGELPGIAAGTGPEIADTCAAQLAAAKVPVFLGVAAAGIVATAGGLSVTSASAPPRRARAVLIATGLRRRRLEVPGERELEGRGVSYSARADREDFAGGDVVVAGGGDGAYENALLLAEVGCRVVLAMRGAPRARPEFQDRAARDARIAVRERTRVVAFRGAGGVAGSGGGPARAAGAGPAGGHVLEAVVLERDGVITTLPARGVVIKVGMVPNTDWCANLERDRDGYLVTDGAGRTSLDFVWAAGDVTRPCRLSIAVAVGSAATAMADIRARLRGEP